MKHLREPSAYKIGMIICIVIVLIGYCKDRFTTGALNYMKEKYGIRVEFVSGTEGNEGAQGSRMVFVKADCEDLIAVYGAETDDGFEYSDNYLAVKYKEEVEDLLKEIVEAEFPSCYVECQVVPWPLSPSLAADSTLEEYLAEPGTIVQADIIVGESSFVEESQLEQQLANIGIQARIRFAVIEDSKLKDLTYSQINEIISTGDYYYYTTIMIDRNN